LCLHERGIVIQGGLLLRMTFLDATHKIPVCLPESLKMLVGRRNEGSARFPCPLFLRSWKALRYRNRAEEKAHNGDALFSAPLHGSPLLTCLSLCFYPPNTCRILILFKNLDIINTVSPARLSSIKDRIACSSVHLDPISSHAHEPRCNRQPQHGCQVQIDGRPASAVIPASFLSPSYL